MSNPLMEKMLDLPEFEVTDFKQNDNDMGFYVQTRRHRKPIFNYFDAPYTNAFVEGLNSVIRSISDNGRGYYFDILRGKVLLSAGRKAETPKTDFDHMAHWNQSVIKDYGAAFEGIGEAVKRGLI